MMADVSNIPFNEITRDWLIEQIANQSAIELVTFRSRMNPKYGLLSQIWKFLRNYPRPSRKMVSLDLNVETQTFIMRIFPGQKSWILHLMKYHWMPPF